MGLVLDLLIKYHQAFLTGLAETLRLTAIIWVTGLSVGSALGALSARYKLAVGVPMRLAIFIMSGVPILVFLFWAHYPLQALLNVVIDPFITAAVVLSVVNILAVCDLTRSHILDFPAQYKIAALVCGLRPRTFLLRIQIPLLLRQLLPALLPMQIAMLHSTLFASLISVEELFRMSQRINALEYKPVHIYTALALFFLAVSLPVNAVAIWLHVRFTRNVSEH